MINFKDKSQCCACEACVQICPTGTISMYDDEFGNYHPHIDTAKCINCGKCDTVCPFINSSDYNSYEKHTFAVKLNDPLILNNSSSGGAFYAIAKGFFENARSNVYGSSFNDNLLPVHIGVNDLSDLKKLQGSKYVRSTVNVYKEIKDKLVSGEAVLFSGTPCQCQAVKLYCKSCDEKLYTVELICHGVIDREYWKGYIEFLSSKHKSQVVSYDFRNKDHKNPFITRYGCKSKNRVHTFYDSPATSYYYYHFLHGYVYRESCYNCPFAKENRFADITIGDFWGYKGRINNEKGISVVIVNSRKGEYLFNKASVFTEYEERTFKEIADSNEQLRKPSDINRKNYELLKLWKKKGAKHLDKTHRKKHWKANLLSKFGIIR